MNRIEELLSKFRDNKCSLKELEELLDFFREDTYAEELKVAIGQQLERMDVPVAASGEETDEIYEAVLKKISPPRTLWSLKPRVWFSAAAVVLICLTAIFFLLRNGEPLTKPKIAAAHIIPAANRATLTLANGKTITLNDAPSGKLAQDGNAVISKTQTGRIVYTTAGSSNASAKIAFNKITTPRGGTYDVILSDGSHVWLNAGSSLSYPSDFKDGERVVELTGEAYFEIAHNGKAFKVIGKRETVNVLGTHFNIEDYDDEPVAKTTLLQGSVKLSGKHQEVLLVPGQMGVNDETDHISISQANIDEVMAWKNGLFVFNNESIAQIMRKASRWYDVDVQYQDNIPNKRLWGTVSRYKTITELMDNIAIAGKIKYKIEGRRITVMK
ncbi:MAG: DUF4974 domain-containing protein [Bacteroidetes bacterium]|nr:DUF4974 domain-containing protein [Bacteroidota bacterium]